MFLAGAADYDHHLHGLFHGLFRDLGLDHGLGHDYYGRGGDLTT